LGTGPVRSVPGGTCPARYTNRSGSQSQTVPIFFYPHRTGRFHRFTGRFFWFVGTGVGRFGEPWLKQPQAGFPEPLGTGPVRPVPGETGPARYMNLSGFQSRTVPIFFYPHRPVGFTGLPAVFFVGTGVGAVWGTLNSSTFLVPVTAGPSISRCMSVHNMICHNVQVQ
jgi:hypothetical protein